MTKKVSVVMTTYNGEKYVLEQLESLRNQSRAIDEVIILDDASGDRTAEIVTAYLDRHRLNGWTLMQNKRNLGWKKNFKRGFDLASGDYLFPCDQDDVWHPDKVEKMLDCMKKNPGISLLAGNYVTVFSEEDTGSGSKRYASRSKKMKSDGSVEILGMDPKWPYVNRPGCVFCFTKKFYDSVKGEWDTSYPHDAILWRYARMDHALGILNTPVIDFRRHATNVTGGEIRTRESRVKDFDGYLSFHEAALKRTAGAQDRGTVCKGIRFLNLRKRFYLSGNIFLWLKLVILYQNYFLSFKSCLGDLYFAYIKGGRLQNG